MSLVTESEISVCPVSINRDCLACEPRELCQILTEDRGHNFRWYEMLLKKSAVGCLRLRLRLHVNWTAHLRWQSE